MIKVTHIVRGKIRGLSEEVSNHVKIRVSGANDLAKLATSFRKAGRDAMADCMVPGLKCCTITMPAHEYRKIEGTRS